MFSILLVRLQWKCCWITVRVGLTETKTFYNFGFPFLMIGITRLDTGAIAFVVFSLMLGFHPLEHFDVSLQMCSMEADAELRVGQRDDGFQGSREVHQFVVVGVLWFIDRRRQWNDDRYSLVQ